ncbi:MAG: Hsp20/alpha crystallin family protein [Saprospiraceae bacterium]|nr:Hsp20/alpha crystallin family protein [Saprospiraceae bacterium]
MLSTRVKRAPSNGHLAQRNHLRRRTPVQHNITEDQKVFAVSFAVPGFSKEDFSIELEDDKLRVEFSKPEPSDDPSYLAKGFDFQDFTRTFTLRSRDIDAENIKAEYQQGILKVILPKSEAGLNPVKTISVD